MQSQQDYLLFNYKVHTLFNMQSCFGIIIQVHVGVRAAILDFLFKKGYFLIYDIFAFVINNHWFYDCFLAVYLKLA